MRKQETERTARTEKQLTAIPRSIRFETNRSHRMYHSWDPSEGNFATRELRPEREDNIRKDAARGIAVSRAGNPTRN